MLGYLYNLCCPHFCFCIVSILNCQGAKLQVMCQLLLLQKLTCVTLDIEAKNLLAFFTKELHGKLIFYFIIYEPEYFLDLF